MKTDILRLTLLAAIVFAAPHLFGQRVVHTNISTADEEASRRASAEFAKLKQRTAQTLAEAEAATQTNISFLTSRDGCRMTMQMMMQQRAVVVKSLIRVIEDTNSWSATGFEPWKVTDSAATVLGNYRAVEAIPCLVSNIQQDTMFKFYAGIAEEDYRKPFGVALANIGEQAVPALLDRITLEESDRVADRCLEVMVRIVGKERAAGLLRARMEALKYPELDEKFKRLLSKVPL